MLTTEVLREQDGGYFPEPDGRLVEVLGERRNRIRVLTRVEADPYGKDAHEDRQGYPTNDDGEPLCVGKDDGQCGRTVAEPGGTCWQHSDDEE